MPEASTCADARCFLAKEHLHLSDCGLSSSVVVQFCRCSWPCLTQRVCAEAEKKLMEALTAMQRVLFTGLGRGVAVAEAWLAFSSPKSLRRARPWRQASAAQSKDFGRFRVSMFQALVWVILRPSGAYRVSECLLLPFWDWQAEKKSEAQMLLQPGF